MMPITKQWATAACSILGLLLMGACSSHPRSSRLTTEDYQEIASYLSGKLQEDFTTGALGSRSASSPKMVVSIQKVVNLTSDMMTESEKWYLMYKLRDALPRPLMKERNLQFVIPAEHLREAQKMGAVEEGSFTERAPTHVMTATFRSATRVAGKDRTEGYLCAYQVTNLKGGEVELSGDVLIKRFAAGRLYD